MTLCIERHAYLDVGSPYDEATAADALFVDFQIERKRKCDVLFYDQAGAAGGNIQDEAFHARILEADQSTLQDHFTWTVRLMDLQHLLHLPMPPRIRILRRFSSPEPLRRSVCR